jgi:hypothetical protein
MMRSKFSVTDGFAQLALGADLPVAGVEIVVNRAGSAGGIGL